MTIGKLIGRVAATAVAAALFALPVSSVAQKQNTDTPGKGKTIKMARATWDTGWWQAEVYKQLFEKLGYDVPQLTTLDNPPFYQAVAQGDMDLWVNGWFPLHNTYEKTFSQGAQKIGYVAKGGALQGYLIDKKTAEKYNIIYVSDLTKPKIQKLFDANGDGKADLVGCPPGWGCEKMIAYQMKAYGWDKHFNVIKAGYSASMADALGRYKDGQPIFFYTWTPNWTVGVLKPGKDVVWLQVKETKLPPDQAALANATKVKNLTGCRGPQPCNLGWPANDIRPVANTKFLNDNPAVKTLLEEVRIPIQDIFAQNAKMNAGADSPEDLKQQAANWIKANNDKVQKWLDDARAAAEPS
jgi:glycine betaine/proline transport system substrate-binding protein